MTFPMSNFSSSKPGRCIRYRDTLRPRYPACCHPAVLRSCSMLAQCLLFAQTAPHFCAAQMVEDLPGDTVGTIRKLLFLSNTQAQLLASTHTHLKKMIDAVSESEQDYGEEGVCTYAREFMCAAGVAEAQACD